MSGQDNCGSAALDALALGFPPVPGGARGAPKAACGVDKLNDIRKAVDQGADEAKVVAS
ncbi:hypothetical protein [Sorangium sp. So ce233]|uniref:hypothetical protein n=1 Tax=Sorangium sp. So ce233 TaxID=3133290 RepID=UPI003F5EAC98